MTFEELLAQVLQLLQREGRLSYRALKVRFNVDDDYLEALNPTASFNLLPCPSCAWGCCNFAILPHSDALQSSLDLHPLLPRRRAAPSRATSAG
jgi:hypothetical protein